MVKGNFLCKVYKPEIMFCPKCGTKFRYAFTTSNKVVQFSTGQHRKIKNLAYRCPNCLDGHIYVSNTANKLAFKGYSYSSKVVCMIDYYKTQHYSREKICEQFENRGIEISDRNIDIIYKMFLSHYDSNYDEIIKASYKQMEEDYGEIRVSVDCIVINEVSYIIFYNFFTCDMLAIWKFYSEDEIEEMLSKYINSDYNITMIITVRPGRKLYNILKRFTPKDVKFIAYEKF